MVVCWQRDGGGIKQFFANLFQLNIYLEKLFGEQHEDHSKPTT